MGNLDTENHIIKSEDSMQIKCKKCIYCKQEEPLDTTPIKIETYSYNEWNEVASREQQQIINETQSIPKVKCTQCGAITIFPSNVTSIECPFCGTSLALEKKLINHFWKPNAILPFKIGEKQCKLEYAKWLSNKWFAPSILKKKVIENQAFKGIYIPYWAYNAETNTFYSGERGENYIETIKQTGKKVRGTRTKWFNVSGNINLSFNNVLVMATDTLPSVVKNALTYWDLGDCVAYSNNFVRGFITELYTKDFRASIGEARKSIEKDIENEIYNDIGGDKQRINHKEVSYNNVRFKLVLLPIWISSFNYNNKVYQFVINGRNGKIGGKCPISKAKVILVIAFIIIFFVFCIVYFTDLQLYITSLSNITY